MILLIMGGVFFTVLFAVAVALNMAYGDGPWCLFILLLILAGSSCIAGGMYSVVEESWQNFLVETGHAEYVSDKEPADRTPYDFKIFRMKGIK